MYIPANLDTIARAASFAHRVKRQDKETETEVNTRNTFGKSYVAALVVISIVALLLVLGLIGFVMKKKQCIKGWCSRFTRPKAADMAEKPQDEQRLTAPAPPATPDPTKLDFGKTLVGSEDKKDVAKVRIMPATRIVNNPQHPAP